MIIFNREKMRLVLAVLIEMIQNMDRNIQKTTDYFLVPGQAPFFLLFFGNSIQEESLKEVHVLPNQGPCKTIRFCISWQDKPC
ncbi:hypothetical protein HMPREF3213_00458 [Heyndrickxia coagulans]|uniref:Uncharacterized protein n=1 Tax=Heyndrickxia coagulans TaxID=1398 RepID=A0A133L0C8_HEYCO|nr:hypothetical protein HMPREF3213_00458 [Heyndrickxia coagulans]